MIFVFSLENETSFNAIYNYYAKMSQYRNMQDIPLILVGTQGMFKKALIPELDEMRKPELLHLFFRNQNSFNFRSYIIISMKSRSSGFILCGHWKPELYQSSAFH